MMEFLHFAFQGPGHFFGVSLLIWITGEAVAQIARAIRGRE